MEICIGVARGLCYLHGLQLTHGAVRTSNILLDEECRAKITNLALPPNLLDNQATEVRETDGVMVTSIQNTCTPVCVLRNQMSIVLALCYSKSSLVALLSSTNVLRNKLRGW
jgi:serine/threonine protein kinase